MTWEPFDEAPPKEPSGCLGLILCFLLFIILWLVFIGFLTFFGGIK